MTPLAHTPHPLAKRIHDGVLQLLGAAMMNVELCEQLGRLDRQHEVPDRLGELRSSLEEAVVELRAIMAELREPPTDGDPLKNRAD